MEGNQILIEPLKIQVGEIIDAVLRVPFENGIQEIGGKGIRQDRVTIVRLPQYVVGPQQSPKRLFYL